MKRFKAWAAMVNEDTTEGRGRDRVVAYFVNQFDALEAVKGMDVMGTNGRTEKTELTVYESLREYRLKSDEAIRARAIKKLTTEERRVLGIEEEGE